MNSLLIAALLTVTPPGGGGETDLGWMAGYWLSCDRGQVVESWVDAGTDTLAGVNLTKGRTRTHFEFLRVANNADGVPTYYAQPGGAPPTPFVMSEAGEQSVTFENPENDFPKRIIYRRDADTMTARIEGGGDPMEWSFRAAAFDASCG